jgi:hypothetical protein
LLLLTLQKQLNINSNGRSENILKGAMDDRSKADSLVYQRNGKSWEALGLI